MRSTPVRFGDYCRSVNPSSTITTSKFLSASSNISTLLTFSPQIPTFENKIGKVFSKPLVASPTSKNVVLKEMRDYILTNKETRLKELNPYIHSYWRDVHMRSRCVCIDEKIVIPNVLREVLVHASHSGKCELICMATPCWWPYMIKELIVKST